MAKDGTLVECSRSQGRQNEPAVAIDPRNPNVMVGSSNDYCGVHNNGDDADGAPIPVGPVWLGYCAVASALVAGPPSRPATMVAVAAVRGTITRMSDAARVLLAGPR